MAAAAAEEPSQVEGKQAAASANAAELAPTDEAPTGSAALLLLLQEVLLFCWITLALATTSGRHQLCQATHYRVATATGCHRSASL
jgi:hypothetical protein